MNYEKALEVLELKSPFEKKDIKKAYYSLAIKYHPDKTAQGTNNHQKFIEIKEAYDFLNRYKDFGNAETDEDDSDDYVSLLKKCIKLVSPNTDWSNLFMDSTFKNIISDCQNISLKIFQGLNKQKSIEIFTFLSTYKDIFHINDETLEKMKNMLKEKRKNDNLIYLRPTLNDLMNEKIYILNICEKQFYIPLWSHELSYDVNGDDLIVRCEPVLPKHISIDDNNNLFVNIYRNISEILGEDIFFELGSSSFTIKSSELLIKRKQTFTLYSKGIPRFNQMDIYDLKRANIYVNIFLS